MPIFHTSLSSKSKSPIVEPSVMFLILFHHAKSVTINCSSSMWKHLTSQCVDNYHLLSTSTILAFDLSNLFIKKSKIIPLASLVGFGLKWAVYILIHRLKREKYIFSKYLLPTEQYLLQCIFITGHQIKFSHIFF